MRKLMLGVVALCAMGVVSQASAANDTKPRRETRAVRLDAKALDRVVAGKITLQNNGGQTPSDNAAGRDNIAYKNPSGKAPPGQN